LEKKHHREGRILIEDSEYVQESPSHEYYGGHFPGLFPEYVKRNICVVPVPVPDKAQLCKLTRGVLFGRRVEEYRREELREVFDLYNVKWIVCWFKSSKTFLSNFLSI